MTTVPSDRFELTEQKLKAFQAGYGTVLFFEDRDAIKNLEERFPLYSPNFKFWSAHSSGAAQIILWTALAQEGVGANLQHYSPLIDLAVSRQWKLPENWNLTAQLVFGTRLGDASLKDTLPNADTVKVFE